MYICTHKSCKLAYALLPGIENRVRVCYILSFVVYLHWVFNYRHYFYDKGTFIGLFKSSASARLYLEVLVTIPRLNFKTVFIDMLLCYISFCFLYSSFFCFRKKWLSYLSHAIRNRVILILCICQLYFVLFHL